MDSLARDTLLGDRYRLARRIAVGGMGEVWRAEDTVLSRIVAVKVLKSELTQERTFLERFRTEARTTASLQANGIANVFDYGEVGAGAGIPVAYLVMEYVDGEPLSAQLARDGRLPPARVLEIVRQAALALAEAHRVGMVHRDVKPGNLLVRRSDGAVKITDFGIARAADAVPLTQNGMVVGTAQYFSPEQAEGRVVGPPSDVYSLGVVAYECLAGRLPFVADSPVTVAMMQIRDVPPPLPPDVPGPVQALVMRTLAKDPRQRFADGGELAEAVRAVQEGRPPPPPAPVADPTSGPAAGPVPVGGPFPSPAAGGPAPPPGSAGGPIPPVLAGGPAPPGPAGPAQAQSAPPLPVVPPAPAAPKGPVAGPPPGAGSGAPYAGSQFSPQSGAAGIGGRGTTPPPARVNPDGVGGTNPTLARPPWTPPPSAGWTGPPGGVRRGRAARRPLWIALALLLALILAGLVTVLMSERGGDEKQSAGQPAAAETYGRHWNTDSVYPSGGHSGERPRRDLPSGGTRGAKPPEGMGSTTTRVR